MEEVLCPVGIKMLLVKEHNLKYKTCDTNNLYECLNEPLDDITSKYGTVKTVGNTVNWGT